MSFRFPVTTQDPVRTIGAYSTTRTVVVRGTGTGADVAHRLTCPPGHRYRVTGITWRNAYNADTDQYMKAAYVTNQPINNILWQHYFAPYVAAALYTGAGCIGGAEATITFSDGAQAYSETVVSLPDIILEDAWYFELTAYNLEATSTYGLYITYEDLVL